jgi:hypothetical protein
LRDVLIVGFTEALLLVLLVSFCADEFLNFITFEKSVDVIVVTHEFGGTCALGLLLAKLGGDRLKLFDELRIHRMRVFLRSSPKELDLVR